MSGVSGFVVRPARPGEVDAVAALFSRSFRTLSFLPELHSLAEDLAFWRDVVMVEQQVMVAEKNGRIVGVMAFVPGWINQLYVDPEQLGRGAGSALVDWAQRHMDVINLWCFQQNVAARAFYEKQGFMAVEQTDGAANEAKCPDVRYCWRTPASPLP